MHYDAPSESENDEDWPRNRQEAAESAVYQNRSSALRKPVPKKKRSAFRSIILLLLIMLLLGSFAVSGLLYLQHPAILSLADKVGLGSYARMFPNASTAQSEQDVSSQALDDSVSSP